MSVRRAHRRVRPALVGRAALSGAAVLGLGVGPLVGIASAAPEAHTTSAATGADTATSPAALSAPASGIAAGSTEGGSDVLWYGLLTTAAVAGAAGAHQFTGGRPRRRV